MKKIINLTIPIGLIAILFTIVIVYMPASTAASAHLATMGARTEPEQTGPPWYDEAWHYRRPVVISNSGDFLPYYQVLIILDATNFNFNLAKSDGSDIRFTDSSGRNPLLFWIESWDKQNQLAYLWVLVSSISPEPNDTTIYLYFNNPEAQPVGDAQSPFDFFDDNWCQFDAGCKLVEGSQSTQNIYNFDELRDGTHFINPNLMLSDPWLVISGSPTASDGILTVPDGSGIRTTNTLQYEAVGFKANYGLGSIDERIGFINENTRQGTMIGDDKPGNVDDMYLVDSANGEDFEYVTLPKAGGINWHNKYHIYEVHWKSGQSLGEIDHGASTASDTLQVPSTPLPVTLYNDTVSLSSLSIDWVYVRQYRDPEPTFTVSAEQGLVELSINNTDSPDPVRKNERLTYQLTISNTSTIDAPGVMVTDTLPLNVQIGPISPSQGSCELESVILCDLTNMPANSTASVTIIITPTIDGEISNNAVVGSLSYELDLSDNSKDQITLVDSVPPVVNWEKPVQNKGTYYTFGGLITLEASATDNDQVAWVEFRLWDHIGQQWISIGTDTTYPYQVPFNSSILVANELYQMYVVGCDRAGNQSDPTNPLQVIYIERKLPVYLPLLRK